MKLTMLEIDEMIVSKHDIMEELKSQFGWETARDILNGGSIMRPLPDSLEERIALKGVSVSSELIDRIKNLYKLEERFSDPKNRPTSNKPRKPAYGDYDGTGWMDSRH
jgi:hypothetical protein